MADRVAGGLGASRGALLALAAVLGVTAAWWAAALWPLPAGVPAWVVRARAVCFGTGASGLPDAAGWVALILQPAVMLAVVLSVWGRALRAGIRVLSGTAAGRAGLTALALAVVAGAGLAAWRVHTARAAEGAGLPSAVVRLDRPAPSLRLVSQDGPFDLSLLRGRPVLVTFAFAHCRTVCPLAVKEALVAQRATQEPKPAVVVVTLDPWRDTPSRLASIAARWELAEDAWVLSGPVEEVNNALDAWGIARSRDERTGDLVHAPLTYIVDGSGILTHRTSGSATTLSELVRASGRPRGRAGT